MMKQVQQMQADMAKAQEELKNEVVEASAGGGMVTVKVTGDLEIKEIRIDPEAVDPEDVELLQDMVLAAVNEAIRSAQELAATQAAAASPAAWRTWAASAVSACRASRLYALFAPPVNRLITELARLPGIGQRTAQRLAFHILRASDQEALGARRRDPRGQGDASGCARSASTSPTEPRCRICQDERRDRA